MSKKFINPPSLFPSEQYGFSQIAVVRGGTTIYLAGQTAWNPDREVEGPQRLDTQTTATLNNIERALAEVGGGRHDVVAMRIYIRNDHINANIGVQEALKNFFEPGSLPVSTWIGVPALAHPNFLIEIEATAVIDD